MAGHTFNLNFNYIFHYYPLYLIEKRPIIGVIFPLLTISGRNNFIFPLLANSGRITFSRAGK